MDDLPPFPPRPAADEVLVNHGNLYEEGRELIADHFKGLASDTSMGFEIKNIQISHSAQYRLIVRADVEWTAEGLPFKSREMQRIDTEGIRSGRGIVFG